MNSPGLSAAVFDTKPYDRIHLPAATGADVQLRFLSFRLTAETAAAALGDRAVCAFVNDTVDRDCLQQLSSQGTELLALRCTGFNHVDLAAARDYGITVTRVPTYSPNAVAEHAVALLLTLNRRIHRAFNRVRELNFSLQGLVGFDLNAKTAGIVGTGKIGRIVARILRGFGMVVVAYDPYPDAAWAAREGITYVDPFTLASLSDVISLHIPLTPETHHIIRRETIERMKPGVVLVNVSRGALIDTAALIDALKSGRLGGVALDVYEEEEGVFFEDLSGTVLQDDLLARMLTFPNVLITAHQAFLTHEALMDIARTTGANLRALAAGGSFVDGSVLT
ncbi:2-hydroxyacid dehydrogenase [Synechococcus sp. CBW1107]|uniref:2-hydroxyacid dehydrogenase n=1 Tax=Synechococcus sp. CBW1107 TaxID=2789857 RepID=UPI002AD43EFB|nr:2-hydroxyacid dehydrogenase [Synechococcus sp. CBW1107]CAK6692548.1 D-lactate dehydrogenase [Synechococcus sp. CBW1107]